VTTRDSAGGTSVLVDDSLKSRAYRDGKGALGRDPGAQRALWRGPQAGAAEPRSAGRWGAQPEPGLERTDSGLQVRVGGRETPSRRVTVPVGHGGPVVVLLSFRCSTSESAGPGPGRTHDCS
jgi:hypothetical protein